MTIVITTMSNQRTRKMKLIPPSHHCKLNELCPPGILLKTNRTPGCEPQGACTLSNLYTLGWQDSSSNGKGKSLGHGVTPQ
eukprot:7561148-Ditylum_brightwellii.AAC.1